MSKAILVMDMPSSCNECDFRAFNVIEEPLCILCTNGCAAMHIEASEYKRITTNLETKPDWCPLKPVPEKADYPPINENSYVAGYNACIDEILEEGKHDGE